MMRSKSIRFVCLNAAAEFCGNRLPVPSRTAAPKATRQLDRLREGGDLIRFGGNEARRAQFEKGARRAAFRAPAFGKRASY